jgi:hypothetical protein
MIKTKRTASIKLHFGIAVVLVCTSLAPTAGSFPPKSLFHHKKKPAAPASGTRNGIFVDAVKAYDESTLEQLLRSASNNLSQLNTFGGNVTNQVGQIQGATANQTAVSLSGANASGTAPTATAPSSFSLPSSFGTSASNFLNEELQLSLQAINIQLLLNGSLNDQSVQGDFGHQRLRSTFGFPIYITVPQGYKYQNAVAEVQVSVCAPFDSSDPSLSILLPQEKTYNVASIVSKSASIGGSATVAGVINLGGSFLHGHQAYYLVEDQDTLAVQRPPDGWCVNPGNDGQPRVTRPVTYAWQFRPVLGQKVVQDGLRQTFAQVSFVVGDARTGYGVCPAEITVKTGWRRYDLQTGRIGSPLDAFMVESKRTPIFDLPPVPILEQVTDNGNGTVTVLARGGFRPTTRVRIGSTVQDSTTTGFEQNNQEIRFVASAALLATQGAFLLNKDGTEWPIIPNHSYVHLRCEEPEVLVLPEPKKPNKPIGIDIFVKKGNLADAVPKIDPSDGVKIRSYRWIDNLRMVAELDFEGHPQLDYQVTVQTETGPLIGALRIGDQQQEGGNPPAQPASITVTPTQGFPGRKTRLVLDGFDLALLGTIAVNFTCLDPPPDGTCNPQLIARDLAVLDGNRLGVTVNIDHDAFAGARKVEVRRNGVLIGIGTFMVDPVTVKAFSDTMSLVTVDHLPPQKPGDLGDLDVVVIGNKEYGLRDNPYYERTDDHATVLVSNDILRSARTITWKRLIDENVPLTFPIPFAPPSPVTASDTVVSAITAVSTSASGSTAPVKSDISVGPPPLANGAGVLTISDGTVALSSMNVATAHPGETVTNVLITGAFTSFDLTKTSLSFSGSGVTGTVKSAPDKTHLYADIKVDPTAMPGTRRVTAQTGDEKAFGDLFKVGTVVALVTAVNPPGSIPAPSVPLTIAVPAVRATDQNVKVTFSNSGITAIGTPTPSDGSVSVMVKIETDAPPGKTDVTVTTGAGNKATGTARFEVKSAKPVIERIDPAAVKQGDTAATIYATGTMFSGTPPVSFSAPGILATNEQVNSFTELKVNLHVTPTNIFAISGSRLTGLKILSPPAERLSSTDTLITFALTDDQVKQFKSVRLEDASHRQFIQALPAATPASTTTPAPTLKAQAAAGIPTTQTSLTISGTGMSQVVAVRYLNTNLAFTAASDTALTLQLPVPPLPTTGIEVVFVYADKSLKPYLIPVAAPSP